ncbi:GDP-mannose 4,6-dehydratase [Desulfuromonas carbonis]|uniref:GDP-mannose 4,6-dehydratase n=1 Tax=Desulfuromonas sp. DDH964 TaxID=1823759 RepID=UPI00078DD3D5|nr:GDP-mannose 4,6-dehydratase [Desulfuromonas sp. DDH964]AMV71591.1 UDP-galacturonate 4-epimerase [Desulfuromonas sp. DDH964]
MSRAETVLVTGGAGFIGSHLVEALLEQGRQVVVFDNFNSFYDPALKGANVAALRQTARRTKSHLRVMKGDLRSPADVGRAVARLGTGVEAAVVHLAAMAGVRPSIEEPRLYQAVNIDGTLNLLEACRRAGIHRLLFASSSSVYGNNAKVPFAECDPVDAPISPYAMTKKAGELLCHNYHHLYGMSIACLRFFTVYGPRQRPDLAIHKFARLLAAGRPIPFFGDGSTRRDYTYVTDTLQGILGALDWVEAAAEPRYDIFNLGESQTVTLTRLVELLGASMGLTPQLDRQPLQPGDVLCTFAEIERARRILGYQPQVGIEEGIRRFVAWFRESN